MTERESGEDKYKLSFRTFNPQDEQNAAYPNHESNNHLVPVTAEKIFEKLRSTPKGEDSVFWPLHVLNEWHYLAVSRPATSTLAEKAAKVNESIVRIKTAYAILAHSHCRQEARREEIEAELETDRQSQGRDQVTLNHFELKTVGRLAATANIPFDPHRRIYKYSDVPISSHINPYGRRHMTTEQIQKWLSEPA